MWLETIIRPPWKIWEMILNLFVVKDKVRGKWNKYENVRYTDETNT